MRFEETTKHRAPTRSVGHRASTRWLIVRDGGGGPEPLCVDGDEGRILPVFSFEEEAEMFLCLGGHDEDDGWQARGTSTGELVSLLYGPCAHVKCVALDPVPGMPEDGMVGLVALSRKRFLEGVLGER